MRAIILLLTACAAWGQAWYPSLPNQEQTGTTISNLTIDAASEKIAYCGFVWTPAGAAKSIRNVGIRTGTTITKAAGSALTVSLQDISTSAGVPIQPDGVQDQTVAISNANIPAVSTWYTTGNLSADRSVAHGDPLCAVIEFDGAGWQSADVITFSGMGYDGTNPTGLSTVTTFAAAAWGASNRQPVMYFVFSDGTYGNLDGAIGVGPGTPIAYNSSTAGADEYALKFSFPVAGTIDGVMASANYTNSDFDLVMYQGTSALTTKSIDANWIGNVNSRQPTFISFPVTAVVANTAYYLSVKPTTTTNLSLSGFVVTAAAQWDSMPTGQAWHRAKRLDAGAWSDEPTERPTIWVRFTPSVVSSSVGGSFVVAQ